MSGMTLKDCVVGGHAEVRRRAWPAGDHFALANHRSYMVRTGAVHSAECRHFKGGRFLPATMTLTYGNEPVDTLHGEDARADDYEPYVPPPDPIPDGPPAGRPDPKVVGLLSAYLWEAADRGGVTRAEAERCLEYLWATDPLVKQAIGAVTNAVIGRASDHARCARLEGLIKAELDKELGRVPLTEGVLARFRDVARRVVYENTRLWVNPVEVYLAIDSTDPTCVNLSVRPKRETSHGRLPEGGGGAVVDV